MKDGAASVLVLFHSPKGTKDASDLTLENGMRGSGDLGAFVSSCWATRLQDPDAPWESASYLKNVKQRDYESDPFEVKSDKLGRLHIVAAPGANVILNSKTKKKEGNEEAEQVIRNNPTLSQKKIVLKLKELGIERSPSWVGNKRFELLNTGVKTSDG
jgi:ATP-dependent DNA ligase